MEAGQLNDQYSIMKNALNVIYVGFFAQTLQLKSEKTKKLKVIILYAKGAESAHKSAQQNALQ